MREPPLAILAAALTIVLAGALFARPAHAGGAIGNQRLLDQLGVRLLTTPPANPPIGSKFEGVVVDPAKLAAKGFPGIKKNDRVIVQLLGPNDAFQIQKAGSPLTKRFKFNPQGVIEPQDSPTKIAPAAPPPVKQ